MHTIMKILFVFALMFAFTKPCFCQQETDHYEAVWHRADSLIKTLKEYKKVQNRVNKTADMRLYVMRVTSDSTDAQNKPIFANTVKYEIGVYGAGNPDGFIVLYSVYYSIRENKIIGITTPQH